MNSFIVVILPENISCRCIIYRLYMLANIFKREDAMISKLLALIYGIMKKIEYIIIGDENELHVSQNVFNHPLVGRRVFTKREADCFNLLRKIVTEKGMYVLSKVRLLDVIHTCESIPSRDRVSQNNRIDRMHIDFVLIDTKDLSFVCAIELDDSSHFYASVKKRDEKKDLAFKLAQCSLIRIPSGDFNESSIRSCLSGII